MRDGMGKFRGKRTDGNGWVYGYLVKWEDRDETVCIISHTGAGTTERSVDPETVGELVHTNPAGVDIYEGDWTDASWGEQGLVEFESFIYSKVECTVSDDIKPVGNIHDNPELKEKA